MIIFHLIGSVILLASYFTPLWLLLLVVWLNKRGAEREYQSDLAWKKFLDNQQLEKNSK